jgi:hypothetical protein
LPLSICPYQLGFIYLVFGGDVPYQGEQAFASSKPFVAPNFSSIQKSPSKFLLEFCIFAYHLPPDPNLL